MKRYQRGHIENFARNTWRDWVFDIIIVLLLAVVVGAGVALYVICYK